MQYNNKVVGVFTFLTRIDSISLSKTDMAQDGGGSPTDILGSLRPAVFWGVFFCRFLIKGLGN